MKTGIAATRRSRISGAGSRAASSSRRSPGSSLARCGEGQNAIWLAQLGWTVRGVDYSGVAIEKARARASRDDVDVDFVQADLVTYEPEVAAFDLVLVLYLHIPESERHAIHARAARAVAPGGTFLLVGHDRTNLTEGVGSPTDTGLLYTPEDIAAELDDLDIERAERVLREVAGADRPAIDVLVRARARA